MKAEVQKKSADEKPKNSVLEGLSEGEYSSQPEQSHKFTKTCFLCSENIEYSRKMYLYRHYLTHQEIKDKLAAVNGNSKICSVCKVKSRSVNTCLRHFALVHNRIENLIPEHAKFTKVEKNKTREPGSETTEICKVGFSFCIEIEIITLSTL